MSAATPATGGPGANDPLQESLVKLVGDKTAAALEKSLGLGTVGDLLRHYPRRYAERGQLTDLARVELDEHVTVLARVETATSRQLDGRRRSIQKVVITDGNARLDLTFFNAAWRIKDLRPGRSGLFSGKVSAFRGQKQLNSPDFLLLQEDGSAEGAEEALGFAGAMIPVYPASATMPSWRIAKCVALALDTLGPLDDPVPLSVRERHELLPLAQSLELIHRPGSRADVDRATERLRWDEAFVLQALLAKRRHDASVVPAQPRLPLADGLRAAFDARLPFELTEGQCRVGDEIAADLAQPHPMNRLLQGEVGSGKTVVALRAMLTVVDAGGQAVLLAPTEVLAQQHARSIRAMLGPLAEGGMLGGSDAGTKVALLTGSSPAAARRQTLLDIASGDAGIVVGTHALLNDKVSFFDLGMVVVDEQHRFGVEQRDALRARTFVPPHLLVMTATPIPRTVAMTVFGDLEVSVLDQLPAGRSPIATHVVPAGEKPHFLDRAWTRMREEVEAGRQAYVVFPRIGEGPEDDDGSDEPAEDEQGGEQARRPPLALLEVAGLLADGPLEGLRVAALHGRLHPEEKDAVMTRFSAGDTDVLLATTVIEVGVDVPGATVMVVMDADRFGVSQLHQLRGRVGRGGHAGLCLLVTDAPPGSGSRERLDAVASTLDGFELSRLDLAVRREGDVLGATQSGTRSSLRLLSVLRDEDVIAVARDEARRLVADDPELERSPALRVALSQLVDADRATYLDKA